MFSTIFLLTAVFIQGLADVVFTAEPCDRETFGLKAIQGDGSRYKQCGPSSRVWIVPCAPQMKFDPVEKVCKEQTETRKSDKYRSRRPVVTTVSPAPEEFVFSTIRPKRPRIKTKGKKKITTPSPTTLPPSFTVPPTTTVIPAFPETVEGPKTAFPSPGMTLATTFRPEYTVKYNGENMTEEELLRRLVDLVKAQKGTAEKERAALKERERMVETQRRREEEMKEEERRRAIEMADKLRREETQRRIAEEMVENQRLEEERRVAEERAEMQRRREEEMRRQAEEREETQRKEEERRIAVERAEKQRQEEIRAAKERAEKKRQEEERQAEMQRQEKRRIAMERAEKKRKEEEARRQAMEAAEKQRKEEERRQLAMERAETQRKEAERMEAMERAEKQKQQAERMQKEIEEERARHEEKQRREEMMKRERERAEMERQSFNRLPSTVTQHPEFDIIRFPPGPTPSGWAESQTNWRPPVDVFSSRPETTPQPQRSTTVPLLINNCIPNGDCSFSYDDDQFCAHPEDPAMYLQCTPFIGRRGRWTPRHCPPGLLFSTHLGRCEKDPYSAYNPKGRVVIPRLPEETNEVTWQGNRELPMAVTPLYPERAIQNTIDSFPQDLLPVMKPIHPEDLYKPKPEADDYEELDLSRIHPLFPRVQPSFLNNFLPFQPLQDGFTREDNIIGAVFKPFIKHVALKQTKNFLDRVLSDEEIKRLEEDRLRVEGGDRSR